MSILNYTLADFRSETQLRLNDANSGFWSSSELNGYINRALLRVAMDLRLPKLDTPIDITAGVSFYSLPSDYLIPEYLYGAALFGNRRLYPSNFAALDKMSAGRAAWEKERCATPTHFVPFSSDFFVLRPGPDKTSTVTLHYTPIPATLSSDSATTSFNLSGQRLVPVFASYLAQMKNDPQKAAQHLAEYKARLEPARTQLRHDSQYRPQLMVPARAFDRQQANPEVKNPYSKWGLR